MQAGEMCVCVSRSPKLFLPPLSLPGVSRCNRRVGPTCKYKAIVLHKTHTHIYTHTDYFTLFSQGAPGPKGEPGEGLNEVREMSIFSS